MRRDLAAFSGTILDDNVRVSLRELCQICGVNAERVMDMVDEGVLDPSGTSPSEWRFGGRSIVRVQIALRLQRDLRINLAGTALALDLLEEVEELRRLIRRRRL
jgi:chaperone modulatory protein CbpM